MGFSGTVGLDVPAATEIAGAAGVARAAALALLPYLSEGIVAGIAAAREEG